MERGTGIKVLIVAIFVLLVFLFFHWNNSMALSVKDLQNWQKNVAIKTMDQSTEPAESRSKDSMYKILQQRNEVSILLNEMRMKVGQMQCEQQGSQTNEQGGWCKHASTEKGGNHMTDRRFIPVLSNFLAGKTIGSFGDGPGAYKREVLKLGEVAGYDAYDGAPYCEQTSKGRVKFLDLSVPQYGLPAYDWILSLEVAEHIPQKYEAVYLDNIFRHAKKGIILSWAVPGQGGLDHINNRPLEYVIDVMRKNGFEIDMEKSKILQNGASLSWLKQNTHVYVRTQTSTIDFTNYT